MLTTKVSPDILGRLDAVARRAAKLPLRGAAITALSIVASSPSARSDLVRLGWVACPPPAQGAAGMDYVPGWSVFSHPDVASAAIPFPAYGEPSAQRHVKVENCAPVRLSSWPNNGSEAFDDLNEAPPAYTDLLSMVHKLANRISLKDGRLELVRLREAEPSRFNDLTLYRFVMREAAECGLSSSSRRFLQGLFDVSFPVPDTDLSASH